MSISDFAPFYIKHKVWWQMLKIYKKQKITKSPKNSKV